MVKLPRVKESVLVTGKREGEIIDVKETQNYLIITIQGKYSVEVRAIPKTKKKENKLDVSKFDPKTSKKLLKILGEAEKESFERRKKMLGI
ncbi:MAG: hypothetical protein DRP18_05380 [Candidatus Aenigmatarchaeota archaeon]|nr:MAG: hypothetical protein DRP18_05380 [Candidatus Aenigmarchaeota archaeon]